MPGSFGTTNSEDGIQGSTASSGNSGIFGHNDATTPAPAGIPGGNGVFGVSTVPNASGVFGANNNGGIGISGRSDRGIGVLGTGPVAGRFVGDVEVTGRINHSGDFNCSGNITTTADIFIQNADCAEDFDIS